MSKNAVRANVLKKISAAAFVAIMCVAAAPHTANADNASAVAQTIRGWAHGGEGELTVSVINDTVTVTGTVTGAATLLNIDIDPGVIVRWEASLSGELGAMYPAFIEINNSGKFEIVSGSIRNTGSSGGAIRAGAISRANVTISGGTVHVSAPTGTAIIVGTYSELTVSGGTVYAVGQAIVGTAYSDVTISGGSVTAEDKAIVVGADSKLTISGGTVACEGEDCRTIEVTYNESSVEVKGGTVTTITGTAIYSSGIYNEVTVRDTGKVTATGIGGTAIDVVYSKITVSNGGTVSAENGNGKAIVSSAEEVYINGGTVSAWSNAIHLVSGRVYVYDGSTVRSTNASAIYVSDTNLVRGDRIIITGGTVISDISQAILANGNVNISGGHVSSKGSNQNVPAIRVNVSGSLARQCTVTVTGGIVSVPANEIAISAPSGTVTVTGGLVFAIGENQSRVIMPSSVFAGPADDGIVVVWDNSGESAVYEPQTDDDLIILPAGATAVWDSQGGSGGIAYENGANTGFLPIPGVAVGTSRITFGGGAAARSVTPRVSVRYRTLTVNSSPGTVSSVRLIDMRGKSVARFTASGKADFSLAKIPAGRYFVELKSGATRERGSVIVGVR